jgi:hypothetical protein
MILELLEASVARMIEAKCGVASRGVPACRSAHAGYRLNLAYLDLGFACRGDARLFGKTGVVGLHVAIQQLPRRF